MILFVQNVYAKHKDVMDSFDGGRSHLTKFELLTVGSSKIN